VIVNLTVAMAGMLADNTGCSEQRAAHLKGGVVQLRGGRQRYWRPAAMSLKKT
jgi:hypothetical protein